MARVPRVTLAALSTIFVAYAAHADYVKHDIFDIPVLEASLGVISVFGGFLAVRGVRPRPYLRIHFLAVILVGVAFSYGGWLSSEVLYDQQVINSSVELGNHFKASTIQTGAISDSAGTESTS